MPTFSEPTSFEVTASTGSYSIDIANGALDALLVEQGEDRIFVIDAFLRDRVLAAGHDPITLVADETAKSLDRMTDLIVGLRDRRVTRSTTLIAVGGGVVQDAAAFAASVYMRGINWVYVPTTLLSMTDSCIGGKSSINVGSYKNIIGTFHPPQRVLADPELAATLSPGQIAAGLCEAAKICLCRGPETMDAYLALTPSVHSTPADLMSVVALSLSAKKWFVEIDEFDRAERLILNFGHTFGHALEAAGNFAVPHGIAVGLGMLAAIEMARASDPRVLNPRIMAFRNHVCDLLATIDGLAETVAAVDLDKVMIVFEADKKHGRDFYAVILPDETGRIERRLFARTADVRADIRRAAANMLTPLWRSALQAA